VQNRILEKKPTTDRQTDQQNQIYTWRYWSQGQYCTGHSETGKKAMETQRNEQQDTKAISVGAKGSLLTII
jgi:hypothetical protein